MNIIRDIDISMLEAHPDNLRKDLGDLSELAASIRENGVLQNLTVVPWAQAFRDSRETPEIREDVFVVVIGHRRLEAAKLAGLDVLPCVVSDMNYLDQIAAMLIENVQRGDLNAYEQAEGFQLMLDLGNSVSDVAVRTGFSATTVRQRVELLDLDRKVFMDSIERGASLKDYAELAKLEDVELKNRVLEKIGTNNFAYELNRALDEERRRHTREAIVSVLNNFATEVKERDGYRVVKEYYLYLGKDIVLPDDVGEVEYFYYVTQYGPIDLLRPMDAVADDSGATDPAESERAESEAREKARRAAIADLTSRAFMLRCDFVRGVAASRIKKCFSDVVALMINKYEDYDDFADAFGIELEDDWDDDRVLLAIKDAVRAAPERALLLLACESFNDSAALGTGWDYQHLDDGRLTEIYGMLEKMGYGVSDEERQLIDGTHPLFVVDGDDVSG